jgi:hypothetical protein
MPDASGSVFETANQHGSVGMNWDFTFVGDAWLDWGIRINTVASIAIQLNPIYKRIVFVLICFVHISMVNNCFIMEWHPPLRDEGLCWLQAHTNIFDFLSQDIFY